MYRFMGIVQELDEARAVQTNSLPGNLLETVLALRSPGFHFLSSHRY